MEEWKQTRDVLKTFDDRIHDLRKYGFSFITGLITFDGFLLPYIPVAGSEPPSGIPDLAKFGALVATTLLIIVLRWFDGNYQGFQYGASVRAIVLERLLNLELSDQIARRYEVEKLWRDKIVLYAGFEAAVVVLSFALISHHPFWIFFLVAFIIAEWFYYYCKVRPEKRRGSIKSCDWALDKIQCMQGEQIRIMMTNLRQEVKSWDGRMDAGERVLNSGDTIWEIYDGQNRRVDKEEGKMSYTNKITPLSSYMWIWTANVEPGLYRVIVIADKKAEKKDRELSRKIHVMKRTLKPEATERGLR